MDLIFVGLFSVKDLVQRINSNSFNKKNPSINNKMPLVEVLYKSVALHFNIFARPVKRRISILLFSNRKWRGNAHAAWWPFLFFISIGSLKKKISFLKVPLFFSCWAKLSWVKVYKYIYIYFFFSFCFVTFPPAGCFCFAI